MKVGNFSLGKKLLYNKEESHIYEVGMTDGSWSASAIFARLKAVRSARPSRSPYVRVAGSESISEALRTVYECEEALRALCPLESAGLTTSSAGMQLALELRVAQRVRYVMKNQQRHMRHFHKLREAQKRILQIFESCPPHKVLEPFAEAASVARTAGLSAAKAAASGVSKPAQSQSQQQQQQQRQVIPFDDEAQKAVSALKSVRVPAARDSEAAVSQLRALQELARVADRACQDVVVSTDSELVSQTFFLGLAIISEAVAARLAAYAAFCSETIERACNALIVLQTAAEAVPSAPAASTAAASSSAKANKHFQIQTAKNSSKLKIGASHHQSAHASPQPVSGDIAGKMALLMCGTKKLKKHPKKP